MRPNQALTLWHETLGALYDVRRRGGEGSRFQFRAEAFHFGEIVLTAYRSAAQTFDRSRARIGRDGVDHITLQFCISGWHGKRDGPAGDEARAGDLLVADLAQPQATGTSDVNTINLTMPRRLLAPLLDAPDDHNLRLIRGCTPLAALLRNHLIGLFQSARLMGIAEAEAVVRPTLALAAAVLNSERRIEAVVDLDPILTVQIRRHLNEAAACPDLTADQVAARFGISRRKLYYLMESHGGFASCVRAQRLHLAQSMLRDPGHRGTPIADIARRCGFAWRTNFSRAYRERFGMTPQETRALAALRLSPVPGDVNGQHMWDWIRALR
ncbi:AraC family transcriptional regulator [Sphingomonas sp. HF-S3]|uniref:AraC family transcriptional regulator n=1 Tax=Sphingomonas rustica TaxID=3103142 RepID=A0ABV0B304_9SPHN